MTGFKNTFCSLYIAAAHTYAISKQRLLTPSHKRAKEKIKLQVKICKLLHAHGSVT